MRDFSELGHINQSPEQHELKTDKHIERTQKNVFENIKKTPEYGVDFETKAFSLADEDTKTRIRLKEIRTHGYTASDVRRFFQDLEAADQIYFSLPPNGKNYITNDTLFILKIRTQSCALPVSLFRLCIPREIKDNFKNLGPDFYDVYRALFNYYGRELLPNKKK